MKRIKRLGLGVVMALALSGIAGTGSASAAQFAVQGAYPDVVGSMSAEEVTLTAVGGIVFGCESTGFLTGISKPSSSLTASPSFNNCTWKIGGVTHKQTFSMNGCSFELKPGAETEAGRFDGTVDVGPPGCGSITLNDEFCQRSYPAQKGLSAEYVIQGKTVEASLDGVLSGTYKGSPANCASSTALNVRVDWTLETTSGSPLTLLWRNGVFTEGGQIKAETYPAFLDGGQDAADQHVLTLVGNRQLTCQDVALEGQLASASSSFALTPAYANCIVTVGATKLPAMVDVLGCSYQIAVAGTFGVSCPGESNLIRIRVETKAAEGVFLCTYEIRSQSGLSSVGLSNFGEGDKRGVSLDFGVAKLAYTRVQGTAGNCGEKTANASYAGTTALTGSVG